MADVVSKKVKTENVLPMIPDHVIAEILARLPVKSLLQFRCVCKTWYSVISDPQFCNKLHRMQPCVLICEKSKKFSTITIESLLVSKNRASMTNPTPLFLPWETEPERSAQTQFLGSCNGLVCVDHKSSSPDRSGLILWNPSTRKFRRLPRPGCYQDNCWTYAWFGYHELVNDYKLVWVNCRYPYGATTVTIKLDVFTSKSKTWRRHNPPTDDFIISGIDKYNSTSIGVLSNGAIHWVTNYHPGAEIRILALHLATQKFRLLEFPHGPLYINTWVGSLLGGCLCLCSVYMDKDGIGMDLWMMKEYGVESSWTKLVSIPSTLIPGFEFGRFYPILFSKEGKKIVAMFDNVCEQSGDADEDEILKLEIEKGAVVRFETLLCVPRDGNGSNIDHHFQNNAVLHMESLVSLPAD